jgi:hypothetical protein
VHVAPGELRVVGDERRSPAVLHVRDGVGRTELAVLRPGPDARLAAAGDRAVGQEGDVGRAGSEVAQGVGDVELERAATDRGRVDDAEVEVEVLAHVQARPVDAVAVVVQRVDVLPGEAGVVEGPGRGVGLDVERVDGAVRVPGRVLVDADDGDAVLGHQASSIRTRPSTTAWKAPGISRYTSSRSQGPAETI